jgi:L-lactate dehydrogenase (cytochrome)
MRLTDVRRLIQPKRRHGDRTDRALADCHDIAQLRDIARRRLPRAVFDYIEGGADDETTTRANVEAFREWEFTPRSLRDVSSTTTRSSLWGMDLPMPLGLAPTGYTRMAHASGEVGVARAAAALRLPYSVSTVATTSIEDVVAAGDGPVWLQLYLLRDRALSWRLLERAAAIGVQTLELSIDTAVSGRRTRDLANGLTIPPALRWGTVLDIGAHPNYWTAMLRAPAFGFANLSTGDDTGATVADIGALFESALTWDDVVEVRSRWAGHLILKGPISPEDAVRAMGLGVDGLHLSNHGGRQLDRCLPPIHLVRPVRSAVGDDPVVIVDSGIRHGMDIAIAIAEGADLAMIGRPYLYGLAAGGERGVEHAIGLLGDQLRRTMQLIGVATVKELRDGGDRLVIRREGRRMP